MEGIYRKGEDIEETVLYTQARAAKQPDANDTCFPYVGLCDKAYMDSAP